MKSIKRHILIVLFLLGAIDFICAQKVTFKAEAPAEVIQGDSFTISYILSGEEAEDIDLPEQIKGFEILRGPTASINYIRERTGRSYFESVSYDYIVKAYDAGTFTIPSATAKVGGKRYKTNTLKVKVISQKALQEKKLKEIENADIFVKPIVNEREIEGEKVFEVSFRIYTQVDVEGISDSNYPNFNDFDVLRAWTPSGRRMAKERYNGKDYYTADLRKYLLLPKRSGKITIDKGSIEVVFEFETGRVRESFFGPVPEKMEIKKTLEIESFTIDAGLVGDWKAA